MESLKRYVSELVARRLHVESPVLTAKRGVYVDIVTSEGAAYSDVLSFSSNDFLGMSMDPIVRRAAVDAIASYGTSNSGSPAICGVNSIQKELENEICQFKGLPHSTIFLNAWMAVQAFVDSFCHFAIQIPHVMDERPIAIFSDSKNHSSINSAISRARYLSGSLRSRRANVRIHIYKHCNEGDLRKRIVKHTGEEHRVVIATDSVFSMDGDIAPLPGIVDAAALRPGAVVLFDEAHATGAIGRTGRGIFEHFELDHSDLINRKVHPVVLSTFSKFGGSAGAALSYCDHELGIILAMSPTSFGTVSITPSNAASALASFRLLREEPQRVANLQSRVEYVRKRLAQRAIATDGTTQVVPILLADDLQPKRVSDKLLKIHGILVPPVWYAARPRLRVVVGGLHTNDEIDRLVDSLCIVLNEEKASSTY